MILILTGKNKSLQKIIDKYAKYYDELVENKEVVLDVLKNEKQKFAKTLEKGLKIR